MDWRRRADPFAVEHDFIPLTHVDQLNVIASCVGRHSRHLTVATPMDSNTTATADLCTADRGRLIEGHFWVASVSIARYNSPVIRQHKTVWIDTI